MSGAWVPSGRLTVNVRSAHSSGATSVEGEGGVGLWAAGVLMSLSSWSWSRSSCKGSCKGSCNESAWSGSEGELDSRCC